MIKENLIKILGEENVFENESMKKHTSFKTGGIADFFVVVNSEKELKELLKYIEKNKIQSFIIGNGTNLLVTENGFRGIIIKLNLKGIILERFIEENYALITIESGFSLAGLKKIAIEKELDNLEFLTGIPGTIGGAVKMNAGAYGSEMKDILVETKVMNRKGKIFTLKNKDQKFEYRKSIFMEKDYIILETTLKVGFKSSELIKQKIDELFNLRKEKQPLEYPNAGSTFKRNENFITAKLIDECGLKGYCVGGAQVSEKHAGFIINRDNATSTDILKLIEIVKTKVYEKTGEKIELEIIVLGE